MNDVFLVLVFLMPIAPLLYLIAASSVGSTGQLRICAALRDGYETPGDVAERTGLKVFNVTRALSGSLRRRGLVDVRWGSTASLDEILSRPPSGALLRLLRDSAPTEEEERRLAVIKSLVNTQYGLTERGLARLNRTNRSAQRANPRGARTRAGRAPCARAQEMPADKAEFSDLT